MTPPYRIGIDLGGTKTAGVLLDRTDRTIASRRVATPRADYAATLECIVGLIGDLESDIDEPASVGIGIPGSLSPASGLVQNANSTWLNGQALDRDLQARLGRAVRIANDANCFALSEARDGAAAGAETVFGVIIGTGCGGGLVVGHSLLNGPRGIGGEWGHNPLPWARADELPGPQCWCGRQGCIESWVSGPALARDFAQQSTESASAEQICEAAAAGNQAARDCLERHADRLGRALAGLVNIVDPDVVVLGGGLSQMDHLYACLPDMTKPFIFADTPGIDIRPPRHGPESGVRGAARLWD